MLDVVPDGIYSLPSGYRIRPNHRMHGREAFSDVFRSPSRFAVYFKILLFGGLWVPGLGVIGSQGFEKSLVRLGNSVKDFVTRSPQSVYNGSC